MIEYDKTQRILRMRVLEAGLSPEEISARLLLARKLLEEPHHFTGAPDPYQQRPHAIADGQPAGPARR